MRDSERPRKGVLRNKTESAWLIHEHCEWLAEDNELRKKIRGTFPNSPIVRFLAAPERNRRHAFYDKRRTPKVRDLLLKRKEGI